MVGTRQDGSREHQAIASQISLFLVPEPRNRLSPCIAHTCSHLIFFTLQLLDPFALHMQLQLRPVPLVAMAVRQYSKGTPKSDARAESDSDSDSDDEGPRKVRVGRWLLSPTCERGV